MTHYYCSIFSKDYAYKGLLLYESLKKWDKDFHFFMICLHDEAVKLYEKMNLKNATIISLAAVEREDPQLLAVKNTRSDKEYIWTSKASVMLYILKNFQYTGHIVWLDGDTYFYSSPEPIFKEWGQSSVLLTGEKWRRNKKSKTYYFGKYNTGFMGFKRDEQALQCLSWFRKKLIRWCYDKHVDNLWSDQTYVSDWPDRFAGVGVVKNAGVNVTPYIIMGSKVSTDGSHVYVNGDKLVLYHHYGFKYYNGREFDLCSYALSFSHDTVLKGIYLPYIRACKSIMERIQKVDNNYYPEVKPHKDFIRNYFNLDANEDSDRGKLNICTLLTKDYVIQGLALYKSLKKHTPRFRLWVLCVDETSHKLLEKMNLAHVNLVSLKNIRTKRLAKVQRKRQIHEFCWTLKAWFLTYLLKNNYNLDSLLYLDADMFFFKDAGAIYREWGDHSIFLTRLGLSPGWERKSGKYSAGLVGFKRDYTGLKCLRSWRQKCLKWCFDRRENGLWGDQKYLDDWPGTFSAVKISRNIGINAGPWNIRKAGIYAKGDTIYLDNRELICYHFSGFKIAGENDYKLCTRKRLPAKVKNIYSAYADEIKKAIAEIKSVDKEFKV